MTHEHEPSRRRELNPALKAAVPLILACLAFSLIIQGIPKMDARDYAAAVPTRMEAAQPALATPPVFAPNAPEFAPPPSVGEDVQGNAAYLVQIGGLPYACVILNTPAWGYPKHYNPSLPRVDSVFAAQEILAQVAAGGPDSTLLRLGSEIYPYGAAGSPPATLLANGWEICESVNP